MDNNTKLWYAAADGDEATVGQCLEAGATVDWITGPGPGDFTALHVAAGGGHTNVARLLLEVGWSLARSRPGGRMGQHLCTVLHSMANWRQSSICSSKVLTSTIRMVTMAGGPRYLELAATKVRTTRVKLMW